MTRGIELGGICALMLLASVAGAADDEDMIQPAIDRGVAALEKMQRNDGTWPRAEIGATALAGLTLLECGVPATDPAVQKAAHAVRQTSIELTHTYSLALAIMFFDRLGDPDDAPLIQSMAIRLLAGQNSGGGWSYECPRISDVEVRRLTNIVRQRNDLVGRRELPKTAPPDQPGARSLPKEIQQQLQLINQQRARAAAGMNDLMGVGDNSNTQFAILGLWVARRHGMPVDPALALVDRRFRASQNVVDGGWGYQPGDRMMPGGSTAAMTCAGLLGLAMGHGAAREASLRTAAKAKDVQPGQGQAARDPAKDPAVRAGLLALGTALGHPADRNKKRGGVRIRMIDQGPVLNKGYYFLWSLERVAVAYGLSTIGTKDWYSWGAEMMLASQAADGSWQGEYGPDVDTSFALLFLRRSNLTRDLTASLKGQVQDPGEVTLKAGGVGGEGLLAKGLKPGIGLKDQPANNPPGRTPSSAKDGSAQVPQPTDKAAAEAARLGAELAKAPPDRQAKLLEQLKEGEGAAYTQALAVVIPQLTGAGKTKARDALAERLTGMTAATLRDKLRDEDREIRVAAALACGMKEDKSQVLGLIDLLNDPDQSVARAAHVALKHLTGRDLGSKADAWKSWWEKEKARSSSPK